MKPCNRSRALSAFAISAIGDEIASNLGEQLDHLASMGVGYIELRSAWGKNVLDLTPGEVARAVRLISDRHMAVSAIASSVGKAPIDESLDIQIARLETALIRAAQFGAEYVRIFSFYVPSCERKRHAAEIVRRLSLFAEMAFRAGITLLLENDCDLFGEHPAEARFLVERVNSPCLRLLFDPGNYVMKGLRPFDQAWPCVADYVRYIHVKDATLADLSPCLPGQGDGQIPALLSDLKARGYTGFLSLEPHLVVAGPSGGFSGPAPFARALHSLRHLIASQWSPPKAPKTTAGMEVAGAASVVHSGKEKRCGMTYLRVSVGKWSIDLDSDQGSEEFQKVRGEGLQVFQRQPGFISYRLMKRDSSTTVAVAEWESRESGKAGAEHFRAWLQDSGIMAHLTLETYDGEVVVSSEGHQWPEKA